MHGQRRSPVSPLPPTWLPLSLSLLDELNYLLSLLTPDDCSFPLAHIIYTIRVMFRQMFALVSQSSTSSGVHRTTSLFCCQVRTLITFLSRMEEMQCLYLLCANSWKSLNLCLTWDNYFNVHHIHLPGELPQSQHSRSR